MPRKKSKSLFDDDDANSESFQLGKNEKFASRFDAEKNRQELKYLSKNFEDEESSDSESEDSDAELITPEVGAKVLATLSRIQLKKTEIYDAERSFFEDDDFAETTTSEKSKPLTFTKFLSKTLKEEGAEAFVNADESIIAGREPQTLGYEEQQKALKRAFVEAAEVDDGDDLFVKSEKTEKDRETDEKTFQEFLKGRAMAKAGDESQLLERYFQADQELDPSEQFLRDYVMFEGWKEGTKMPQGNDRLTLSRVDEKEDEEHVEETEKFETAFNFRFEEAGASVVEGHARKVFDSVRQKEEKRRKQRLEKEAKKKGEKEEKKRELERYKNLKRKEFVERLAIIQRIAGVDVGEDVPVDFDKEFDEKEHELQMKAILGDDFDEGEEEDAEQLLEAPEELADTSVSAETEKLSAKQKKRLKKLKKLQSRNLSDDGEAYAPIDEDVTPDPAPEAEDEDNHFNNDTVSHTNEEGEPLWYRCDGCELGIPAGKKRFDCNTCEDFLLCKKCFRSVKHTHQLVARRVPDHCKPPAEAMSAGKSAGRELGLPTDESMSSEQKALVSDLVDEYYSLDYEDIIGGDLPVRFKYAKVEGEDYGMSIDDVLNKTDQELSQVVSLKKLAPYRTDGRRIKYQVARQTGRHAQPPPPPPTKVTKKRYQPEFVQAPDGVNDERLAAYGLSRKRHR